MDENTSNLDLAAAARERFYSPSPLATDPEIISETADAEERPPVSDLTEAQPPAPAGISEANYRVFSKGGSLSKAEWDALCQELILADIDVTMAREGASYVYPLIDKMSPEDVQARLTRKGWKRGPDTSWKEMTFTKDRMPPIVVHLKFRYVSVDDERFFGTQEAVAESGEVPHRAEELLHDLQHKMGFDLLDGHLTLDVGMRGNRPLVMTSDIALSVPKARASNVKRDLEDIGFRLSNPVDVSHVSSLASAPRANVLMWVQGYRERSDPVRTSRVRLRRG